ncbi:MAG: hypothetical protein COB62_01260 [Piscirickettsiaceae bacterium]|nr:MAG: hypothetical protein COB62_01260 [Piscirickettsiaceae bacterium]
MKNKTPPFTVIIIFALVFLSAEVSAKIFKCPSKNGETLYQQTACKFGEEIADKATRPSLEQQERSRLRNIEIQRKVVDIDARLTKENNRLNREAKRQQRECNSAKDSQQYWDTNSKHAYSIRNQKYYEERAEQEKKKVKKLCR